MSLKKYLPEFLGGSDNHQTAWIVLLSVLVLLAGCSGGGDDDDDDDMETDDGTCGIDEFTSMFNECMGEDRTPEEIEAQYAQDCADPDGMIECACQAYADYDCDTAQGMLLDCSKDYCFDL